MGFFGFADGLQQGRKAAQDVRSSRRPILPPPPDNSGGGEPSPLKFGYYCPLNGDNPGAPNFFYGERHIVLFGLNGAGKSTRLLIELLMTSVGRSIFVFDIKGELAFQTADERQRYSNVKIINPYKLHGMRSDGFNPLSAILYVYLNKRPLFYDAAKAIADALIEIESGSGQYWTESAQGLLVALIMWEVIEADREHRTPSLFNVRMMLTEPDEYASGDTLHKQPIKGLSVTAARMIAHGNKAIASLVARFVREHGRNELASIQSTASTQTEWMLSEPMQEDLEKEGTDFRQLRQQPTSIYVVLPPDEITHKRRWSRVLLASALSAHYVPGPMNTLFVLDEFRASVGKMNIINDMWSLVRGYGVQLMPILQSALQLQALFDNEWENYAAQAGIVATLGPIGDLFSARWLSERCATTTILQASFNLGDGFNSGDGLNSGTGFNGSGFNSNRGYGINHGRNQSSGFSLQQTERRLLLPQELMDIQPGHGLMWLPGMGTRTIPFFAPNYWRIRAPWVQRVKPNPYRIG